MIEAPQAPALALRLARDDDSQDLFGLLSLCFADYPGCFVDPHEDLQDLREPSRAFVQKDEAFWVLEDERGRVCACVAIGFPEPGTAELHRLYVRPDQRRRGLGARLVAHVEAYARDRGAVRIVLWSDTRFSAAHRLYQSLGYGLQPGERPIGDISGTVEFHFQRDL
ncbi:GNAT family N-acetyltransferase [Microvirga antarctica]|uniref:GNAT family N-acetyltransferase n=1 Tax=Microvirga antarctica TaxID=2819233 RepID=UPI001B313ED1|nr:GNAT family N-acetyltransferase [Microvirga antarctica]